MQAQHHLHPIKSHTQISECDKRAKDSQNEIKNFILAIWRNIISAPRVPNRIDGQLLPPTDDWFAVPSPINSWLLSCRWKCPSAGASCVATARSSSRSDASLTLRSARTRCHRLSFSGALDSTRTSSGPLPTSKEKSTREEAEGGVEEKRWVKTGRESQC